MNGEIKNNHANFSPRHEHWGNDEKGYKSVHFTCTMEHPLALSIKLSIVYGAKERAHGPWTLVSK